MKIRIGIGPGQGMPANGESYSRFIDDLERLRFDSVWFSERLLGPTPDPSALMAFTAARTSRLKFGMSVMVLPGRNPLQLAKQMATIDMLSGGRLLPAFGLGSADEREHAAFGVRREDRAPMFNEALTLMRRLWTEDDVTHEGRFYRCEQATVLPHPARRLDVWMGGIAPSELRRVGRLADGWLPSFIAPSEARAALATVVGHATDAGRTIDPEHFGVLVVYSCGAELQGPFVERIKARRPDAKLDELFPVGLAATRALLEKFIECGFSKFVLVPAMAPADMTRELETVAEGLLPLET